VTGEAAGLQAASGLKEESPSVFKTRIQAAIGDENTRTPLAMPQ